MEEKKGNRVVLLRFKNFSRAGSSVLTRTRPGYARAVRKEIFLRQQTWEHHAFFRSDKPKSVHASNSAKCGPHRDSIMYPAVQHRTPNIRTDFPMLNVGNAKCRGPGIIEQWQTK
jgi:hypothetical protein